MLVVLDNFARALAAVLVLIAPLVLFSLALHLLEQHVQVVLPAVQLSQQEVRAPRVAIITSALSDNTRPPVRLLVTVAQ